MLITPFNYPAQVFNMYPAVHLTSIALVATQTGFQQVIIRHHNTALAQCNARTQSYFPGKRSALFKKGIFPVLTYLYRKVGIQFFIAGAVLSFT